MQDENILINKNSGNMIYNAKVFAYCSAFTRQATMALKFSDF